jgi:hypothetical protein
MIPLLFQLLRAKHCGLTPYQHKLHKATLLAQFLCLHMYITFALYNFEQYLLLAIPFLLSFFALQIPQL